MELKYICKICNFEAKNNTSLTSHLQYNHKDLTIKELNEILLNLVV